MSIRNWEQKEFHNYDWLCKWALMQSSLDKINTDIPRLHVLLLFYPNYIFCVLMLITGHCRGAINFPPYKHTYIFQNKQKCQSWFESSTLPDWPRSAFSCLIFSYLFINVYVSPLYGQPQIFIAAQDSDVIWVKTDPDRVKDCSDPPQSLKRA